MKVDIYYIKSPSNKIYIGQARQYLSNGKNGELMVDGNRILMKQYISNHCILLDML